MTSRGHGPAQGVRRPGGGLGVCTGGGVELSPELALWLPRVLVGLAGVVLCVDGARAYRVAVVAAAFGAGAVGAASLAGMAAPDPLTVAIVAAVGGVAAVILARLVEKVALVVVGAVLGGAAVSGVDTTLALGLPWWSELAGVLVGAAAMPWVFPLVLVALTPAVGGVLVAWAAGRPDDLRIIGAAYVVGVVAQLARRGRRRDRDKDDA